MSIHKQFSHLFALSTIALLISACGGGSGSSDNSSSGGNPPPANGDLFTVKANTWTITPVVKTEYCYDIDTQKEVPNCSNDNWDLKFYMDNRIPALFTNSGVSGSGQGGVLSSPFDSTWLDLIKEKDATQGGTIPAAAWVVDSYSNAFMDTTRGFNSFFEYDLFGDHQMSPNFKTYLITTNRSNLSAIGTTEQPVFALQITGYYQGTTSGHISLRYIDTAQPTEIKELKVDATQGWNYVNLKDKTVSSSRNSDWQIAFNRYNVEVNSEVGSYIANQPDGFYDAQAQPITSQFKNPNAVESTKAGLELATKATKIPWSSNTIKSLLNPTFQGAYPNKLSYGWYNYYPTVASAQAAGLQVEHTLAANPDAGSMIRGNNGKSYARMRLKEIRYADPKDSKSQTTWTFEFDVQPSK